MASMSREGKGPIDPQETVDRALTLDIRDPDPKVDGIKYFFQISSSLEDFIEHLRKQRESLIEMGTPTLVDYGFLDDLSDTAIEDGDEHFQMVLINILNTLPLEEQEFIFERLKLKLGFLQEQKNAYLTSFEYLITSWFNLQNSFRIYEVYSVKRKTFPFELTELLGNNILELHQRLMDFATSKEVSTEKYDISIEGEDVVISSLSKTKELAQELMKKSISVYTMKHLFTFCSKLETFWNKIDHELDYLYDHDDTEF